MTVENKLAYAASDGRGVHFGRRSMCCGGWLNKKVTPKECEILADELNSWAKARVEEAVSEEKEKVRQWEESFKGLAAQARVWAEGCADVELKVKKAVEEQREKDANICDDLVKHRPTTGAGKMIGLECAVAIRQGGRP